MIDVQIILPIGMALKLADWLVDNKCSAAANAVLVAIDKQGLPQVDEAIEQKHLEARGE